MKAQQTLPVMCCHAPTVAAAVPPVHRAPPPPCLGMAVRGFRFSLSCHINGECSEGITDMTFFVFLQAWLFKRFEGCATVPVYPTSAAGGEALTCIAPSQHCPPQAHVSTASKRPPELLLGKQTQRPQSNMNPCILGGAMGGTCYRV